MRETKQVKQINRKKQGLCSLLSILFLCILICVPAFAGTYGKEDPTASERLLKYGMVPVYGQDIKDGTYEIQVSVSSPMLQIEKTRLTVKDGTMTAELTVKSSEYSYIYIGTGEEAKKAAPDRRISFTENPDGTRSCTISAESLDRILTCAAYSEKHEQWYQYSLLFDASSLPEKALLIELPDYDAIEQAMTDQSAAASSALENDSETMEPVEPMSIDREDGEYSIEVSLSGGSGKSTISSPTLLIVKEGKAYARLQWSSSNYDYMIVGTEKYLNTADEGANSVFEIPIEAMDEELHVIADTTAMGIPHEVDYTLIFYRDSIGSKSQMPQEAAKRVIAVAIVIIVGGGILNRFANKRKRV